MLSKRARRVTTIVSVVVVLVIIAILVGLGYLMYRPYEESVPGTVRLRDISIIVLAVETLVVVALLLIIAVLIGVFTVMVYDRVIPVLEQMNRAVGNAADTVQTVRGTTSFIGEKMVQPVIEVSSYASGVRRILKELRGLWPRRK
jgi:hypothetical protein